MSTARDLKPRTPESAQRHQSRIDIRLSDGIKAQAILPGGVGSHVEVYDLNSFGASFMINSFFDASVIRVGTELSLHLKLPDKIEISYTAKICWSTPYRDGTRVGVEFCGQVGVENSPPIDETTRYELPDYFPATGFYYKPYMFLERGHVRVTHVSATDLGLSFFDSEVILFRGLRLKIWILSSARKQEAIEVEIRSVRRGTNRMVVADARIVNQPKHFLEWMAHQLVFVCERSPSEVRRYGFAVNRISNGFRFRFVRTQDEYEAVLRLRYQAYLEAGKIDDTKTPQDMKAPMDPKSRILICYHGDRVVGSVAISFPTDESEILDTERAFPGGYPLPMPPKNQLVEISRLCTDSQYRKTDLLNRMFEYTYKVTVCGDRDYIATSTDAKLWPLYKKLGFRKTGMSYAHPYLSGLEHHVILGKRTQPDFGAHLSPLVWNYLWRDMNLYMDQRGLLKMPLRARVKQKLMVALGRLLKIQTDRIY